MSFWICDRPDVIVLLWFDFKAPDRLDVTVTTTLINMINHTIASWSEDYYRPDPSPMSAVPTTETPSLPSVPSSRSDSRHDDLNQSMSLESPLSSPTSRPESSVSLWSTGSGFHRRRSPFVPFLLRNQTGGTSRRSKENKRKRQCMLWNLAFEDGKNSTASQSESNSAIKWIFFVANCFQIRFCCSLIIC